MAKASTEDTTAAARKMLQAERDLFAAYRKFAAAYAKVMEAHTPDMQAGSVDTGTPAQKRQHALWERRLDVADAIYHEIMRMPALTINGMLLKIHVRGWHHASPNKGYTPLIGALDWDLGEPGLDDDADLLDLLRSDLRRLTEQPTDKLADQLEQAIADYFAAQIKWGPITVVANATCDVRYPDWAITADEPKKYKQAMVLRSKMTAKHEHHERALNRAADRCERLTNQIMERNAKDESDLRARTLVMLYEMCGGFFAEPGLRFPDDGGATRFLFDHAAERCGLGAFVRNIEKELAASAREITKKLRAIEKEGKERAASPLAA